MQLPVRRFNSDLTCNIICNAVDLSVTLISCIASSEASKQSILMSVGQDRNAQWQDYRSTLSNLAGSESRVNHLTTNKMPSGAFSRQANRIIQKIPVL